MQQKLTQHCKAVILQLKKKKKISHLPVRPELAALRSLTEHWCSCLHSLLFQVCTVGISEHPRDSQQRCFSEENCFGRWAELKPWSSETLAVGVPSPFDWCQEKLLPCFSSCLGPRAALCELVSCFYSTGCKAESAPDSSLLQRKVQRLEFCPAFGMAVTERAGQSNVIHKTPSVTIVLPCGREMYLKRWNFRFLIS